MKDYAVRLSIELGDEVGPSFNAARKRYCYVSAHEMGNAPDKEALFLKMASLAYRGIVDDVERYGENEATCK